MVNFEEKLECVKAEVGKILSTSPSIIRQYTKHLLKSQGKYIRATAVLACAQDSQDDIHHDAVIFAAAIELLHLATLVHDDIMDNADVRRGVVTLHKKFGRKTAVICGDYLLALSMNLLSQLADKNKYLEYNLSHYMMEIALGELTQHLNNGNYNISIKQYLTIIQGKTAALFEAAFYSGVLVSDELPEAHDHYRQLGHNIGMIFQLSDDSLDFEETVASAKKPVQSDFEQGVVTLPLIHAFKRDPEAKKKAARGELLRSDINRIVALYDGVGYTKRTAQRYYKKSVDIIDALNVTVMKRERLIRILDQAMRNK